jgi:tetratricopeptide (TPR) repeat protein
MNDSLRASYESAAEILGQIADEFTRRLQAGEAPEVTDCVDRHPELKDVLPHILAALEAMQSARGRSGPDSGGGSLVQTNPSASSAKDETDPDTAARAVLGDFTIVREIGRGGMGVVYEAFQRSLARRVALKMLPPAISVDVKAQARFRNESQAAAGLDHPNIVDVYGVGSEDGVHFYAMRFIEGWTLAQVIDALRSDDATPPAFVQPFLTPQRFRHIAALGIQAAEALHHAHGRGVVHRDIKPGNLMIDREGHLWITDFGLAHMESAATLTASGHLVGTLRYMSPEQAHGRREAVDYRTDIYSLGATLYELATLAPVFDGTGREKLLRQIADAEPPKPRTVNRSVPVDLETILLRSLEKNSSDRYTSARELAEDLRRFVADRPILARPSGLASQAVKWARRHTRLLATVAVGLAFAVAGLGTALAWVMSERNAARLAAAGERHQAKLADEARRESDRRLVAVEREAKRADDNVDKAHAAIESLLSRVSEDSLFKLPRANAVRKSFLEDAVALNLELLAENPTSELSRYRVALAQQRLGRLYRLLGEYTKAVEAYEKAIQGLDSLAREFADNGKYSQALVRTHGSFGLFVLHRMDQDEQAEQHLREAVTIAAALAERFPEVAEYRNDRAAQLGNLAAFLGELRRYKEAEHLQRQVVENRPDDAGSHANLALTLINLGRGPEAESEMRAAIDAQTRTDGKPTPVMRLQFGQILARIGKLESAVPELQMAIEAFEQQHRDEPDDPESCECVAGAGNNLGMVLIGLGRREEAVQVYERCTDRYEELVIRFPEVERYRGAMSGSYRNLMALLSSLGPPDKFERVAMRLIKLDDARTAASPDLPDPRFDLARDHQALAQVLQQTSRGGEALAEYEAAIREFRTLVDNGHKLPQSRLSLGGALSNSGLIHHEQMNDEAARLLFEEAIVELQGALAQQPANAPCRRLLGMTWSHYSDLLLEANEHAAAAATVRTWWTTLRDDPSQGTPCVERLERCAQVAAGDPSLTPEQQMTVANGYSLEAAAIRDDALARNPGENLNSAEPQRNR